MYSTIGRTGIYFCKSGQRHTRHIESGRKELGRRKDNETEQRLDIWCSKGADRPYGDFAIEGAKSGRKFGTEQKDNDR